MSELFGTLKMKNAGHNLESFIVNPLLTRINVRDEDTCEKENRPNGKDDKSKHIPINHAQNFFRTFGSFAMLVHTV